MLTTQQAATLKAYILSVPALASLVAAAEGGTATHGTQDASIASAINGTAGSAPLAMDAISKDQMLLGLTAFTPAILSASAGVQAFWLHMKDDLRAANGPFQKAALAQAMGLAIQQGIIPNQAAVDAIWSRACSQPEAMFGAGVVLTGNDISLAMRGAK